MNQTPEPINRNELARYLSGQSTPEEERKVQAWLETQPEMLKVLSGYSESDADYHRRRDPENALDKIRGRLRGESDSDSTRPHLDVKKRAADRESVPSRTPRSIQFSRFVKTGVLVAFILVVAMIGYFTWDPFATEFAFRELTTAPGERTTFTLEDGSTVELNVASTLRVPVHFRAERREVFLEGEAFFDVASEPDRPFLIRSREAVIQVVGTSFNVQAYEASQQVSVAVLEGKVALSAEDQPQAESALLGPGQFGRLILADSSGKNPLIIIQPMADESLFAWRRGQLVFKGTPLDEVARALERWYGVEVELANEDLSLIRLDGAFEGEPLSIVLSTIAAALDIDFQIEQNHVVLFLP